MFIKKLNVLTFCNYCCNCCCIASINKHTQLLKGRCVCLLLKYEVNAYEVNAWE